MANRTKQTYVTKKHLARLERERLQTRYILIGTVVIASIVILLVGYGFVSQFIVQPRQAIAVVNGSTIDTGEFQDYAHFLRGQLVQQYQQIVYYQQLFGDDPNNASFFQQQLQQVTLQLEDVYLGQTTIDTLIEDRLIKQEAERRGITVDPAEVDKAVQEYFSYFPDGTPTPVPTSPVIPTSTLNPTQLAIIPPTASPTPTIESTPELAQTPTLAPSPTAIQEPTATSTPYTSEAFRDNLQSTLRYIGVNEDDLRRIFESQILREKIQSEITADLSKSQDQVWARHILVADEATAQQVLERLQNGEDFAALAQELSTDTGSASNGGDLGWFGIGVMDPNFEKSAFNLDIGDISEPVQTQFGWHIIQVLGHEERPLSDSEYSQLVQQSFQEWLQQQRDASEVEIFEIWQDRVPAEPVLPALAQ
jgi:parvulin-like peptidyl-prolyl isomerase